MITFFPTLIVALLWVSLIKDTKVRRRYQIVLIIIYGLLGAMYI